MSTIIETKQEKLPSDLNADEILIYKLFQAKSEYSKIPLTLEFDGQDLTFYEDAILFGTNIGRLVSHKNVIFYCRSAIEPKIFGKCEIHLAKGIITQLPKMRVNGLCVIKCPLNTVIDAQRAEFVEKVYIDEGIIFKAPDATFKNGIAQGKITQ